VRGSLNDDQEEKAGPPTLRRAEEALAQSCPVGMRGMKQKTSPGWRGLTPFVARLEPYRPRVTGLALPPWGRPQVGGCVTGPEPSAPLWIMLGSFYQKRGGMSRRKCAKKPVHQWRERSRLPATGAQIRQVAIHPVLTRAFPVLRHRGVRVDTTPIPRYGSLYTGRHNWEVAP
jgi:hypothetical protein